MTKKCPLCLEVKPEELFSKKKSRHGRYYYRGPCKACYTVLARGEKRLKKYGVTPQEVEEMHRKQGGLCALCRRPFTSEEPNLDHCHRTSKVRGLLHRKCNTILGQADDSIEILNLAVDYLEFHREKTNG